jgi:hypothetical protein
LTSNTARQQLILEVMMAKSCPKKSYDIQLPQELIWASSSKNINFGDQLPTVVPRTFKANSYCTSLK